MFERIADPSDIKAIFELEALTIPRLRDEAGDIGLVPQEDRISGPGTTVIMVAFTRLKSKRQPVLVRNSQCLPCRERP